MKILISIFTILLFATTSWATDLSTATLKQLVAERPDLVRATRAGSDEGTFTSTVIKDEQGRRVKWIGKSKDLDGVVIRKRVNDYSYYDTGEINVIVRKVYKGNPLILIRKARIKHSRSGRQPVKTVMPIEVEEEKIVKEKSCEFN